MKKVILPLVLFALGYVAAREFSSRAKKVEPMVQQEVHEERRRKILKVTPNGRKMSPALWPRSSKTDRCLDFVNPAHLRSELDPGRPDHCHPFREATPAFHPPFRKYPNESKDNR